MFSKEFFIKARNRLQHTEQVDCVVLSANGLLQRSADIAFPFRQDSNFWYLTGLELPDALFVLDLKTSHAFIVLPKRLKHRDAWEGEINTTELTEISGITTFYEYKEGWAALTQLLLNSKTVGTILPFKAYEPNYGLHINPAKVLFARHIKKLAKEKLVDLRATMATLRSIKTSEEIQCVQKAIDITGDSLQHLRSRVVGMHSERDIAVFLQHAFMSAQAEGHAYDPIIASGKNATTIHYEKNSSLLNPRELLLLDVGASYAHYAADISRTWALQTPSKRQQDVYTAVKTVQDYAYTQLQPGVTLREYEQKVRNVMNDELTRLGLTKGGIKQASVTYFPHLTSHFLGLDVHDSGHYDAPLQENMILTVEPGIYIPEESIGVRLEDNVLITATGIRVMSKDIPTDLLY